jgi:hypothetical protein
VPLDLHSPPRAAPSSLQGSPPQGSQPRPSYCADVDLPETAIPLGDGSRTRLLYQTRRQPVLPSDIDPDHFAEVRGGLGYADLVLTEDVDEHLVAALQALPHYVEDPAVRWERIGHRLVDYYNDLRNSDLRGRDRLQVSDEMRAAARQLGCTGSWCRAESP